MANFGYWMLPVMRSVPPFAFAVMSAELQRVARKRHRPLQVGDGEARLAQDEASVFDRHPAIDERLVGEAGHLDVERRAPSGGHVGRERAQHAQVERSVEREIERRRRRRSTARRRRR